MSTIMNKKNNIFKIMIIILTFVVVFTLSGCESGLDYSDFKRDHLESWEEVLTQDERQYLVYFYGVNCSYCITIKDDVLNFANENNADLTVFFIDSAQVTDREEFLLYDPITGDPVTGTPTMLVVKEGVLVDMNVGAGVIQSLLEKIQEGSYAIIK